MLMPLLRAGRGADRVDDLLVAGAAAGDAADRSRISSSVPPPGCARRYSCAVISIAGVQKPHCRPWWSWNACCSATSVPSGSASPSTVSASDRPPGRRTSGTSAPSRRRARTLQLPQKPFSQARCVPVRSRSSRRKSASVRRGSTCASRQRRSPRPAPRAARVMRRIRLRRPRSASRSARSASVARDPPPVGAADLDVVGGLEPASDAATAVERRVVEAGAATRSPTSTRCGAGATRRRTSSAAGTSPPRRA